MNSKKWLLFPFFSLFVVICFGLLFIKPVNALTDVPQTTIHNSTSYLPSKIILDYSTDIDPYDFSSSLFIPKFNEIDSVISPVSYSCSLGSTGSSNYNVLFGTELFNYFYDSSSHIQYDYVYSNINISDSYLDIYFEDVILPVYDVDYASADDTVSTWDAFLPDLIIYNDSLSYDTPLFNIVYIEVELTGFNKESIDSQVLSLSLNFELPDSTFFYTVGQGYTSYHISRYIGNYVSAELYPQAEDEFVSLGSHLNYINYIKIGLASTNTETSSNSNSFGFTSTNVFDYSLEDFLSSDNLIFDYSPLEPVEMSNWLLTAVGAFMDAELFPGLAIGGIFAVLVAFPVAIWFLKIVLGG